MYVRYVYIGPPSVPNNVSLETDGTIVVNDPTTKIAINWQAPQDPGSPQFTSYRVEAVSRDGVVFPFSATDRHLVLTGLLPGTTYNIQVFAVVEFGGVVLLGPPSANLTANTTESGMYKLKTLDRAYSFPLLAIANIKSLLC